MLFQDRQDAAEKLAQQLQIYANHPQTLVIGLPRGGLVTAFSISKKLNLPLNFIIVRKIGAPNNPELAIGAITEEGQVIFHQDIVTTTQSTSKFLTQTLEEEKKEIQRRLNLYRQHLAPPDFQDKTLLLVDDGIATGATILAAVLMVKSKLPAKIMVVAPVISLDAYREISREVDQIITLKVPSIFESISQFYKNFPQINDQEVVNLLKRSALNRPQ